ncbi:MAG: SulP family inorganic anion transporter [Pseudomonadota bacterium]
MHTTDSSHNKIDALDPVPRSSWTPSFRDVWRYDLAASVVVFLVALPLCLGIALASGAPLLAGVVTGVIGGIVVGVASGSHLMVSGPAAGLTAIVLSAITTLGGFEFFLTAVVLAGLMQMALGVLRAGVIGYYFPNSVIRGMLAGIGLIIIIRQLPYAIGADAFTAEHGILAAINDPHHGAIGLSVLALAILLLWDMPFMKHFKIIPGALVAVLACTAINMGLHPELAVDGAQLVALPVISSIAAFDEAMASPIFSALSSAAVWTTAITIAIIASLETLLSLEATDRMDPLKREAPANRELLAQGFGNTLCGLFGGLPMTGVIVRSSANVYAGARTKASAIFHGILLLIAVLSIPLLLNFIPLAVLAVILIHTGWKLANPKQLQIFLKQGFHQWLPFIVTIVAILLSDLLIGISIGLAVSLFFILQEHLRAPCFVIEQEDEITTKIRLNEHLTFLHKASLSSALQEFTPGSRIVIDGSRCKRIDHDVLDVLREFKESATNRLLNIDIKGIDLTASSLGTGH